MLEKQYEFEGAKYKQALENKGLQLFVSDDNKTLLIVKGEDVIFKIDQTNFGLRSKTIQDD